MVYHLKTRIAIAVSLLMLALLLVTSWLALVYFEREFHTTAIAHLSTTLATTAHDIDAHLRQAGQVLQAVDRGLPRPLPSDPRAVQSHFQRFATERLTFDDGLRLFAPTGRLLAGGPGQQDDPDLDATGRNFFSSVLKTRLPVISEPFRSSRPSAHPVVTLARPLLDERGDIVAVLAGEIDLLGGNLLARLLGRPVGEAGHLALIDHAGVVVLCPNHKLVMAPGSELLPSSALSAVVQNASGRIPQVEVRGQRMLVGYQKLQSAPWTLVGLYPESEIHGPINQAYVYTLLTLALLSLISMVFVRRLSVHLTSPLLALTEEVRRQLESDTPFTPPPTGQFSELGELAGAIQSLMAALATRGKELGDQLFFLQNLIDTIPSPIFYKDAAFRYLGCNRSFEQYIGMSRDELVGKTVYDIAPPELAAIYQRADQELWDQGGAQVYEASVKFADGSLHDVIFYKSIFRDTGDQPAGMLGVFLDITERKRAEEKLQLALAEAHAAREQADNILRSAADGLVVTNSRNRVTHINQVAMELLGVTAEEVIGKSYVKLFKNQELRRQAGTFFAIRDVGARQHDFLLAREETSEPDIIQARSTPLRDRAGKLAGLVTLLRDVTRERELDRIKSEFISTAAHEMRTPMSVIVGYTELLLDQELVDTFAAAQRQEFLQEICRKAEALSRLVDDLFDISRIEAGLPLALDRTHCDLNSVIEEVVQRFAVRSPRHQFIVELASPQTALVDCSKMDQVFDNLISNAVKYSPGGGRIEIRSEHQDNLVRFAVADEGIGMTPAQLVRVFDKFYRADSSDTAVGGLGLGMSIVKVIIETHGGRIWVKSRPGEGTTVFFEIPLG